MPEDNVFRWPTERRSSVESSADWAESQVSRRKAVEAEQARAQWLNTRGEVRPITALEAADKARRAYPHTGKHAADGTGLYIERRKNERPPGCSQACNQGRTCDCAPKPAEACTEVGAPEWQPFSTSESWKFWLAVLGAPAFVIVAALVAIFKGA